ncbi:MAG: phosphopantetheine-binding protein [Planctomycetota bacterium]
MREFTAPRNPTEEALAKIWAEELGLERAGVTDDFFALGGYSVLAARVFVRIEEVFGKRLPMTVLFEAATVEALAAILDGGGETAGPLVTIQEGDGALPVFCIANSDAVVFANLARRLGPRQTIYGLHPQGLIPVEDCRIDIVDLASAYLERVTEVRPEGPYLLVGTCTSGVVALEMARQLRQKGGEVALLAMIDPPGPWTPADWTSYGLRRARRVLRHLGHHARQIMRLPFGQKGRYLLSNLRRVSGRYTEARREMPRTRLAYEQVYWRALKAARLRYQPAEYDGSVVLFLSPQDIRTPGSGSGRRWIELARGGAAVCEVSAVHREMLREPYVRTIARRLYDDIEALRRKYGLGEEAVEGPAAGAGAAAGEAGPAEFVPPRTPVEQKLCGIWADILAVEEVGVNDHFLYLGGDSVLAARVVSRIRMDLGIEVEMTDFLMSPTVAQLAPVVANEMNEKFGTGRTPSGGI